MSVVVFSAYLLAIGAAIWRASSASPSSGRSEHWAGRLDSTPSACKRDVACAAGRLARPARDAEGRRLTEAAAPRGVNAIAARIDRYLRAHGSPLAGHGLEFVTIGARFNVSPVLMVAISGVESSYATAGCGPPWRGRNPFGLASCRLSFPTYADAITYLARGYHDTSSPWEIARTYNPGNADGWAREVDRHMAAIT